MDPGGLGALIGVSVMVFIVCAGIAREKGDKWVAKLKQEWKTLCVHSPVINQNPILVRSTSKQFQMKEILPLSRNGV
jgi:hypothetical protein